MNWNKYFDKIYLINLPERTDRLKEATEELGKYGIPFEVWPGIKCENGQLGIYATIYSLLENVYYSNSNIFKTPNNVLIFEDDVKFINDPREYFKKYAEWTFKDYDFFDIFYLGLNTDEKNLGPLRSNGIVYVNYAYGCHAMCISRHGIYKILQAINNDSSVFINPASSSFTKFQKNINHYQPIDKLIANKIHSQGKCMCSYPMLATQRDSYSDIEKKVVDNSYIEKRFIESTKHLFT